MLVINTINAMRKWHKQQGNKSIGFVPTMGYLHDGHMSLVKTAKQNTDLVVVSIFVNPLQFNVNEDLSKYPRDIARDTKLCENNGVDVIFAPSTHEIYANGYPPKTIINVDSLGNHLCGSKRQGHFDGVCTIVAKLFNIVNPNKAFFGQKDIQQLRIIQNMVSELNINIEIISCPTHRNSNGLALSSRNKYLSKPDELDALIVPNVLQHIVNLIKKGETDTNTLITKGLSLISKTPNVKADYLEIVDYNTLQPINIINSNIIIATAIFIGNTRLIDNIIQPFNPKTENTIG